MRLTSDERAIIKRVVEDIFGKSQILLFGSRLDPIKKGGDIDLFVIPQNRDGLVRKKVLAAARLERHLLKPVDIVIHYDFERTIEREALRGVEL